MGSQYGPSFYYLTCCTAYVLSINHYITMLLLSLFHILPLTLFYLSVHEIPKNTSADLIVGIYKLKCTYLKKYSILLIFL